MPKPAFTAIDPAALDAVTGGRRSSTSSRSSSSDDQLLDALNDIKGALADLGKPPAQSGNGLDQLLPILMMQLLNPNRGGGGSGPGCGGGNGCGGGRW